MNEIFYKKKWQKRTFLFKFYYKNKMAWEIEAKIIKEERYKALVLIYPYKLYVFERGYVIINNK